MKKTDAPIPIDRARRRVRDVAAPRQVSVGEFLQAGEIAMLVGPARALGLFKRVPALFKERGWGADDDMITVAICAVSCVKLGAFGQGFKIPACAREADKWRELGARADATDIVSRLDLGRLLEP